MRLETTRTRTWALLAALAAVAAVVASGLLPGALEIMDRLAIQAAEAAVHAGYPQDAAALLIVELDGEAQQVEEEFRRLKPIIEASGAYNVRVAQDEADRLRIWKGRKSAFSAVGRLSPEYLVNDGVVPRSRLGEALTDIFGPLPEEGQEAVGGPVDGETPDGETPGEAPPDATATVTQLIEQANQQYAAALEAQRLGDWAEYGRQLDALEQTLQDLQELESAQ